MLRTGLFLALLTLAVAVGETGQLAARCTPYGQGVCRACKNCNYCQHCAKGGGTCTVCRR